MCAEHGQGGMTPGMLCCFLSEVRQVCVEPGFGVVGVVIEKHRPRRLRVTREPWLEERTVGPPRRDGVRGVTV